MASEIKLLHSFDISLSREIDEEITRTEGDKTIVEKTKVNRPVSVSFGLKKPYRFEKDEADIYRSVWETKYLDAGIYPQALLLKRYANAGGILSNEDRDKFNALQRDFLLAETELRRLQVNERDNSDAINAEALKLVTLRQELIDFKQAQSVFFENTAESKARQKLIQWVVLYLTYYKPVNDKGEPGEWTPFFAGNTVDEKLDALDKVVENNDELWNKAADYIALLAAAYVNGGESSIPEVAALVADEKAAKIE